MRLAAYQPQYFPRLHYMARLLSADVFVISDTFQFVRAHNFPTADGGQKRGKSYQADTPIKSSKGPLNLTVPVQHHGFLPISETLLAYDRRWPEKHLGGIQVNYAGAKNFKMLFPQLRELLKQPYKNLGELNTATIVWALTWILVGEPGSKENATLAAINTLLQSEQDFRVRQLELRSLLTMPQTPEEGDATDHIIATCKLFSADEYYCGGTAVTAYLDIPRLNQAGIQVVEQKWHGGEYTQQFSSLGFLPNLSILDLLMNENRETVRQILRG